MGCFLVRGKSMQPYLRDGDLVLTRRRSGQPRPGDVMVYRPERLPFAVVHRVVEADKDGVVVRGDANSHSDPERVPSRRVLGQVWCVLPRAGRLLRLLRKIGLP
jgi:signal peptidase I